MKIHVLIQLIENSHDLISIIKKILLITKLSSFINTLYSTIKIIYRYEYLLKCLDQVLKYRWIDIDTPSWNTDLS